ncbi:MAG: hypothetical protein EXS16_08690 [Gemmataceae bacterium]|nr:hypothetical protein [Gemmataceae bacterium]
MIRKSQYVVLGLLGVVAALGTCACCIAYNERVPHGGGHGGVRHSRRSPFLWFVGGGGHSAVGGARPGTNTGTSRGTTGTSRGGFGSTSGSHGGIGA